MICCGTASIFAFLGIAWFGSGFYGCLVRRHIIRRLIAFNVIGSGTFLLFGATGARRADLGVDPVPQALIITGLVVALAATALIVALALRYAELKKRAALPEDLSDT